MKKLPLGPAEKALLRKSLKNTDFFADLPWINVDALVNKTKYCAYGAKVTIFKQGAKPDAFYVIYEGMLEVKYKKGIFKDSQLLEELGPGNFFGEIALVDGIRRTATVRTLTRAKLFVIPREVIDEMLVENPKFREHLRAMAETRKFLISRHT